MTLLSLENLSKSYGALKVTDDISLSVAQGEIVGILGPNGAGKTTLFNLVAGTVQPNAGRVVFAGQDVTGLTPRPAVAWAFRAAFRFRTLSTA